MNIPIVLYEASNNTFNLKSTFIKYPNLEWKEDNFFLYYYLALPQSLFNVTSTNLFISDTDVNGICSRAPILYIDHGFDGAFNKLNTIEINLESVKI